jgi:hypothetical protein
VLRPFRRLAPAALEALRYRGEDVARGITRNVVSEARQKELRLELLNSERLKEYFEEHDAERWGAGGAAGGDWGRLGAIGGWGLGAAGCWALGAARHAAQLWIRGAWGWRLTGASDPC